MGDELLNNILKKYDINQDLKEIKIKSIDQYPHVITICFPTYNLIIKRINKNKISCCDLNNLYHNLSKIKFVEIPKKTSDNEFYFYYKDEIIIVYRQLSNLKTVPNSTWWANCLGSIHNLEIEKSIFTNIKFNLEEEAFTLLKIANNNFDSLIKENINTLLNSINDTKIDSEIKFFLSHSDPYNENVMQDGDEFKLIDTEGMRLLPREFDIQRLFHTYVSSSLDSDDLLKFCNEFLDVYQNKTNSKININLLKQIYVYDLIRVLSWLSIVCNDDNRLDIKRQSEQLKLYKNSLREEKHIKILKKI